jgi:hypothetical protein
MILHYALDIVLSAAVLIGGFFGIRYTIKWFKREEKNLDADGK